MSSACSTRSIKDSVQIFEIDGTTGVVYNSEVLDREKRSLYTVPITISDRDNHTLHETAHVRIQVDDQDDNLPEAVPRTIILGYLYEIPDVIILHTYPVDADQVGFYSCRLFNGSQTYNVSSMNVCSKRIFIT